MQPQNHTPIHDMVKKHHESISRPPEAEPARMREPITLPESKESEKDIGKYVEFKNEHVELPDELKNIGVENTQPIDLTVNDVKLPIADEKIVVGMKAPVNTSLRWLSAWAMYLLHHAHLTLKVVHGKVMRVRA